MPKYIDADALKEAFLIEGKDVCDAIDDFDTKWGASQKLIEEVIDSAPAADVEPVVRCRDCKYRNPENHKCDNIRLERIGCEFSVRDDYFCAYGEYCANGENNNESAN